MATQPTVGAHEMPLLLTKLDIPPLQRDAQRVPRPRLIERLNTGLERKLTLVSAPAGFGKTTLLSEWVHTVGAVRRRYPTGCEPPPHVAWLSLDESDSDPARFLAYLIAALRTIEADIASGAFRALQSPQPPPTEAILTATINEIAAIPGPVVLVLDDYHLIDAQPVHDALTFLLRHLPPQMHLFIATREDPLLPLARLRARGQLTELRAVDLRFTSSEAAEFLNQVMGLDLSAENIAALETRTEGWIAGLQLAAVSMRGRKDVAGFIRSFAGSHHFVLDYLVEEVLEQQPEGLQRFLLHTSILDRLTGPLCDAVRFGTAETPDSSFGTAVTGQKDGQATLELLEHANLFIVPLDNERRWYRYHHLFADLLRQRLRRNLPRLSSPPSGQRPAGNEGRKEGGLVAELHRRASEWYERNGFADQAIAHALHAGDFERAASLIDEHADATWKRGEHAQLARWLAGLPRELLVSKPQLCIFSAWYLFATGQRDAAERVLLAAEQALGPTTDRATETAPPDQGPLSGPDGIKLRGRLAAVRALMGSWWGDPPAIIQHARQALEYLPKQDPWRSPAAIALGDAYDFGGDLTAAYQARLEAAEACKAAGDIYFCLIANLKVAITLRALGRLPQTIETCRQQLQLADESGLSQTAVAGCLSAQWGEVLAERNDLDGAIHRARKGVELTEGGDLALLGFSNLCLARVLCSRGDLAGAEEIIRKLEDIAREHDLPSFITRPVAAWRATIWLAQGELEAASQWARERALDAGRQPTVEYKAEHVVLARILLAQGSLEEASSLLRRLLEAVGAGERTSSLIEILVLHALAFQARGEPTQAMAALERALALAEPGGFVRAFVDQGPPMARLLYGAATRGIAPDYVRRLLAAFPVAEPEQAAPPPRLTSDSGRVEPLSERELEVLQLISKGLTNPEIASRLFLALNTVKAHSRNIYGKLGVHSRTQAVARARAMGVLPSS